MADIFQEVEEGVRQDRLERGWRKYGVFVWLLAGAIVVAVATREYLSYRAGIDEERRIVAFEEARAGLETGDIQAAEATLAELAAEDSRLSAFAANYLAGIRLAAGESEAAADVLAGAADGEGRPFERLALLKLAYIRSEAVSLAELEALLAPLLAEEAPISALAQELVAAKAFAEGDYDRARTEFNYLRFAPNAPNGVVQRAEIALATIPRAEGDEEAADPSLSEEGAQNAGPQEAAGTQPEETN